MVYYCPADSCLVPENGESLLKNKTTAVPEAMQAPQIVRSLIGHRQVGVALKCLPSLLKCSSDPMSIAIHDDGTLTDEDRKRLLLNLPGATIVDREAADEIVEPLVERYPNCRAFRQDHLFALKLFDMALIGDGDMAYCDSDILFLRPFAGLFRWPDAEVAAIFMRDRREPYALRPWHVHPVGRIKVPQQANAGLMFFRTSRFDLDFIEWFLGRPQLQEVFNKRSWWIEQTCWAALGWQVGCRIWDKQQIVMANPAMSMTTDVVGIHFVATYRDQLGKFCGQPAHLYSAGAPVLVRSEPARQSSSWRLLVSDVAKK